MKVGTEHNGIKTYNFDKATKGEIHMCTYIMCSSIWLSNIPFILDLFLMWYCARFFIQCP